MGDDPLTRGSQKSVTLNDTKENIDAVGADPDAVIIRPPQDSPAVTIKGPPRNNSIRNLTTREQHGRPDALTASDPEGRRASTLPPSTSA
jgi:hypothetical protein